MPSQSGLRFDGDSALQLAQAVQVEVRNAARSLVNTVRLMRDGPRERPDKELDSPRPK